jgi:hypothetical protein
MEVQFVKQIIWSDPNKEWRGFHFGPYWLDEKILRMPLTLKHPRGPEEPPTTVGEIYKSVANRQVEIEDDTVGVTITLDGERLVLKCPTFHKQLMLVLFALRKEGVEPFSADWFYYDHDSCVDDPHEHYKFFVVYDNKIVKESVFFSDYSGSEFDPSVFQPKKDMPPNWKSDEGWLEAHKRFWYRKFYTETQTGQFMTLRSDEPPLYDYQPKRPSETADFLSQNVKLLRSIRTALVILVSMVALLILIQIWK